MPELLRDYGDAPRMMRTIVAPKVYNPGDSSPIARESDPGKLTFRVTHLTKREVPKDPRKILIFPCFGEFGCETIGAMYALPRIKQNLPGCYSIVLGWSGREYIYRNLVDQYWELDDEHQWLREYCRAFHHKSRSLAAVEKRLRGLGRVVSSIYFSRRVCCTTCNVCGAYWKDKDKVASPKTCPSCSCGDLSRSLFATMPDCFEDACLPPKPGEEKMKWALENIPENSVGIFARSRKCYGRNLPPDFYLKLINEIKRLGMNPVWLGEPSTNLKCPAGDIFDFSGSDLQKDMELCIAAISRMKFTIQFWTASTRLSAIAGTPFILFESPDQLWDGGEEGYRLELASRGNPKKLVASHYLSMLDDQDGAIRLAREAIEEVLAGDFSIKVGMVEHPEGIEHLPERFNKRIGLWTR